MNKKTNKGKLNKKFSLNKTLKLPAIVDADDYHEFKHLQHSLECFGVYLDYCEIDTDLLAHGYAAVFYAGSKNSNVNRKFFAKLSNELKTSFKNANGCEYIGDVF